ncbi:MAG: LamG domain-containing protein, partial [Candidatus Marinimicrobia bacterium]|nr:LamG domain-containing protein [Candidatus Neomarinimicrobiota bacterium]
MKNIFYIIFISFFSLTVISCAKKDDSSSSSSSTSTSQTFVDANFCRLTKNTSNRNSSLIVNDRRSDSSRHTEQSIGRVLYVDKSALSQYQRDDYLLIDPYDSNSDFCGNIRPPRGVPDNCDEVDLGDSGPILGSQFTQEAWIWPDKKTWPRHREIMGASHSPSGKSNQRPPTITYNYDTHIRYGFGTGSSQIQFIVEGVITPRAWNHIAVTFDGTTMRLFVNGEQVHSSQAAAGMTPISEPVRYIGENFQGKIDEVRMWNVARTQDEIQANMNKTLVGNETGLVAYYPMDVNNNWEIIDKSPRANHAKITDAEILSRFISDNSSCTNGPDGTTSCPFPTIRSALDNVTSGDHIYIRKGRYTELLNKWQLNHSYETEGPKIVIEAYPNEEVIIDGTVALNDNNSNWVGPYSHTLDNGTSINIYKTVLSFDNISREIMTHVDNISQVFVNGRYMIPAMPMNFKNPTDPTTGNPNNPEPGTVWAGIGRSPFSYPADHTDLLGKPSWGPDSAWGHDWYMPGKLEHLDNPEEWAFDSANNTLYLYASDNYTPSSTNVRVRVRDRYLAFTHSDNIEFKNIHFFAGSLYFYNNSYITFEDSKFSFSTDMFARENNSSYYRTNVTFRNVIFEFINEGSPWGSQRTMYSTFENVLFRYNDWFAGSARYAVADRNYRGSRMDPDFKRGDNIWRYVTIENSYTAGIFAGYGSLVEYTRLENLYDGCDCSGIQRNAAGTLYSTTRYTWIINAPGLNGMRFDSACGGNHGDIYNVVSIGNHRGFRLKGDYHDVYHVTAYDNGRQDISLPEYKYCGLDVESEDHLGNWNSNLYNSIAEGSLECTSRLCRPGGIKPMTDTVEIDGQTLHWIHFSNLETSGIWFGRSMSVDKYGIPDFKFPVADPKFEMESPWIQNQARSDTFLSDKYGGIPWNYRKQSYDFRPKKGSYLIDSGVVIPGVNNGEDVDNSLVKAKPGYKDLTNLDLNEASVFNHTDCTLFNHPNLYSGQNRKYVGDAPDIGAYEYGDSVYWIPGYRYPHPSVPIPNDNASDVPIDHSLVWNYPYKKDYSNTEATVTVSGPGVNRTAVYKYPYNVHFQTFEPGGTYNWSVTVDNVSGGNWSFKTDDKIYPLNDRSVDTTDKTSLIPYQMRNLEVSNNKISFLRFDI